ncbi:MAG: Fic family protein [Muribaculaceae bacterium]|nr:Fic family protein [Muribaculaceae bacterium]
MKQQEFDEYIRQIEPFAQESANAWKTAIGLQQVDGLKPSSYLLETARKNIEGDITIDEVRQLLDSYYKSKTIKTAEEHNEEEADKVSANIKKILSSRTLAFNTNGFISIHRRIFDGVFSHAGEIRNYNISKKEWVLRGNSVDYLNWEDLRRALDFDIQQERDFDYKGLTEEQKIKHICHFVSGLWQIHPFCEGNTRTTAVFTIQYLRSIGYNVDNEIFALHSWYFRNALVRANYKNSKLGINYDSSFLEKFFQNLLLGANYELKNRYLVIDAPKDLVQQNDTQEDKFDTQEDKFDTQGYFTEGVIPQKKELEAWIEHQIKKDPKISTGKLAELAKVGVSTIKRRIAKHGRIKFVGSGFSGYWIVERSDDQPANI